MTAPQVQRIHTKSPSRPLSSSPQ